MQIHLLLHTPSPLQGSLFSQNQNQNQNRRIRQMHLLLHPLSSSVTIVIAIITINVIVSHEDFSKSATTAKFCKYICGCSIKLPIIKIILILPIIVNNIIITIGSRDLCDRTANVLVFAPRRRIRDPSQSVDVKGNRNFFIASSHYTMSSSSNYTTSSSFLLS